jgi:hypothetical protein
MEKRQLVIRPVLHLSWRAATGGVDIGGNTTTGNKKSNKQIISSGVYYET